MDQQRSPGLLSWKKIRSVVYNRTKAAIRRATKNSIFSTDDELVMASLYHTKKLDLMLGLYQPKTVLDLGCGTGRSLEYLLDHGIDATGVEGSALAITKAKHPERIVQHDLNKELDLGRRFDVLWSIEVVEHIHPKYLDSLLKTFANHSDRIVMSAAHPGQGGEGHFNEQPPEYWIAHFEGRGFKHDPDATGQFRNLDEGFCENMLVFFR